MKLIPKERLPQELNPFITGCNLMKISTVAVWFWWEIQITEGKSLSFEPDLSIHCLAALDLGAGVEQPFNCLINQNRRAVLIMGRSTVCFSVPYSQAAEGAISHLCKQEQKRPTLVQRWLSRTDVVLGRVIPGRWVLGLKVWSTDSKVVTARHFPPAG